MTSNDDTFGGTVRRTATVAVPLLVAATGTAAAHGGGSDGGMMGGSWGFFGGMMGLWGLLWMGLLLAVPLLAIYTLAGRESGEDTDPSPRAALRERYVRGELSEEEFERRLEHLQRTGEGR